MIIKTYLFALIIFVVFCCNITVKAQNTYQYMANTSAKVVQGRIISKKEVRYNYDIENPNLICGYILNIKVTKSYKGGEEDFRVFATNSDVLMDKGSEYLLFARKNIKFGKNGRDAIDFINCDKEKSTRMDISDFEFLSTRLSQQIFPLISYSTEKTIVDEDTGIMKRGEWMLIVDRISNNALPYSITRRRLNNGNLNVIEEMNYKDFLSAFKLK